MKLFRRRVWKYSKRVTILIITAAILLTAGGASYAMFLGGASGPSSTINLQDGLVGWWKMHGNTNDSSGNGYNGTLNGGVLANDKDGYPNQAYSFDGSSHYIQLPTINGVRSISMWVNIPSTQPAHSGWHYLLDARLGNAYGYFAQEGIGSSWVKLYVNGSSASVSWASIPKDQWVHLYLEANASFNDDVTLMARYSHGEAAAGTLGETRFYNRSLSDAEIKILAKPPTINVAQGEKGLVGWWKMNGTLQDSSPYRTACSQPYGSANGGSGPDRKGRTNGSYAPSNLGAQCGKPTALQVSKLTISAWVNSTSYNTAGNGIGGWGGVYDFSIDADSLCLNLRDNLNQANFFCTTGNYALNTWYYVAATYDGSTVQLYVNGAPVAGGGAFASGIGTSHYADSSNVFNLGVFGAASSGRRFMGYIDDLRVYNRALSSTEIANQYNSYDAHIAVGGSGQSGSVSLGKGLVGYWPMNGNAKDSTPYRDNGTPHNVTLTADRKNRANSAYSFNGTSSDITVGDIPYTKSPPFTVSAWFNSGGGSGGSIVNKYQTASWNGFNFFVNTSSGTRLCAWYARSTVNYTAVAKEQSVGTISCPTISQGVWHFAAVTVTSSGLTLYIDGATNATSSPWTGTAGGTTETTSMSFGNYPGTSINPWFTGSISDVRIYSRALSTAEIQALYQEYN